MAMQKRHLQQQHQSQRIFSASEVAEYEYCSLAWWYESYESLSQLDSEELFARMVELEDMHGQQATTLPEYQVIEHLLLRQGAFSEGREQHREHAAEVAELEEERAGRVAIAGTGGIDHTRRMLMLAVALVIIALILIGASFIFMGH